MSFFKSEKFKALEQDWYDRLAREGFEDIESRKSPERQLKAWHSHYFLARYDRDSFERKADYYRLAQLLLHEDVFQNQEERTIWELHAQGTSLRMIASSMQITVCRAHKIIRKLAKLLKGRPHG